MPTSPFNSGTGAVRWSVPLLALFTALAHPAPAAQARYPIAARVIDAAAVREECPQLPFETRGSCGLVAPARGALRSAAVLLFEPADGRPLPTLEMSVVTVSAEARGEAGGYQLMLEMTVQISAPGGRDSEVHARGETLIADLNREAFAEAVQRAANDASTDLRQSFLDSQFVAEWLVSRQVEPQPSLVWPVRQSARLFADLGGGALAGGDGGLAPMLSARLGAEWGRFSVQGFAAKTSPAFTGAVSPSVFPGEGNLDALDTGVEAAVSVRALPYLDVRGGPGLHYLFGSASLDSAASSFHVVTPTLFGSLLLAFNPSRAGTRMTLSVEARKYFSTSVDLPSLSRTVPVASYSFAAFLGFELPLKRLTAGQGAGSAP